MDPLREPWLLGVGERDGYFETETTMAFGVTVIDLAFVALLLTMQMLTFRVLWLGRATKDTE